MTGLTVESRGTALRELREHGCELLVIGGGITGAGIAQDAASRGVRVGLLEKADFASGTSSRSSKLIHGGLRYLKQFDFKLMYEATHERHLLQQLAPHLVEPLGFLIPIHGGIQNQAYMSIGMWMYDLLAGPGNTIWHRWLTRPETLAEAPGMRDKRLRGAFRYHDCRTDDARLVLAVIQSAAEQGARIANYAEVVEFTKENGQITGVVARDARTGETWPIRGQVTVAAGGPWTDELAKLDDHRDRYLEPSKGIHVTVSAEKLPVKSAILVPAPEDRFLFLVPWYGRVIIGTTDTPYDASPEHPRADRADVKYILDSVNDLFPHAGLCPEDIISTWAGLRPLIKPNKDVSATTQVSREHQIFDRESGLVAIAGGKLTTYRPMAEDLVNHVLPRLKKATGREFEPSRTAKLPLLGGPALKGRDLTGAMAAQARRWHTTPEIVAHLVHMYAGHFERVLQLIADKPALALPLAPELPFIAAQVVYAARHEMALTLEDVLARRTRLALLDRSHGVDATAIAAPLLARELGWTEEQTAREIAEYGEIARREFGSGLGE